MEFLIFVTLLYFLPTLIAVVSRQGSDAVGIFLVNFLLGWIIIGWRVALNLGSCFQPISSRDPARACKLWPVLLAVRHAVSVRRTFLRCRAHWIGCGHAV